jgi:membrane-bound ClpP family serine protease
MDTFPYADWAEALEANGAIFTWADNESAIFVLTGLGIAAFVLSLIHLIRTEDRNLNHAAARLVAQNAPMVAQNAPSEPMGGE